MKFTNPPGVANPPMYPFKYSRPRHSNSHVTCPLSSSGMLAIPESVRNLEAVCLPV